MGGDFQSEDFARRMYLKKLLKDPMVECIKKINIDEDFSFDLDIRSLK